jgi:putative acetyltransferase
MQIRGETIQDYAAISAVQIAAFGDRADIALIIMLQRQRPEFDPELSLVAEMDGKIVGHVLFSPEEVFLKGQIVKAVNLSPIGVDPNYQKEGIGKLLIEEGHEIAKSKGYAFSFLIGHPTYYPRFGYITKTYGFAKLKVIAAKSESDLTARPVQSKDLGQIYQLWQQVEGECDFALDPGQNLLDWLSPNPVVETRVYADANGQIVGYTRLNQKRPDKLLRFLAKDQETAHKILSQLAATYGVAEFELPLHPTSFLAQALGTSTVEGIEPCMVCSLSPSPFEDYHAEVQAGTRAAGSVIWATSFDFD